MSVNHNNLTSMSGSLSLFVAGFFYALYSVFSRMIGGSFATFYQTWSRGILVLGFFIILGLVTRAYKKIQRKHIGWFLVISISSALTFAPYYLAVLHLSLGTTMFMFYAVSLICSIILGATFFNEHFTKTKVIAFFLAVIGIALLFIDSIKIYALEYIFFACIAGLFYSFCSVFTKKVSSDYSNVQISTINALVIFVVNFLISILMKEAWYTQFFTISWLANALYAVASILTTMLVIFGFKRVEAQLGSLLLLAELPFVVLFGWLFYQEIPSSYSIIGGILILVSMSIPNIKLKAFRLIAEHK